MKSTVSDLVNIRNLLLIQASVITSIYLFYGIRYTNDSQSMIDALDSMYNPESDDEGVWNDNRIQSRILRPFALWLAYPLKFLGNAQAFAIVSVFFQLLIIPFFYHFALLINENKVVSFYTVLFFILSPLVINHTLLVMTDIATWALFLITLYYSHLELNRDSPRHKYLAILSFFCGLSCLMKEFAGSAIIYINLMILTNSKNPLKSNMSKVIIYSLLFVIPFLFHSYIIYLIYDYFYYDWIIYNKEKYGREGLLAILASIKNAYGFLFIMIIFQYLDGEKYRDKEFNIMLFSSLFLFMISIVKRDRFLYITFPILIPVGIYGLYSLLEKTVPFKFKTNTVFKISLLIILGLNYFIYIDNHLYVLDYLFS